MELHINQIIQQAQIQWKISPPPYVFLRIQIQNRNKLERKVSLEALLRN
jgi:hypothetical protein